MTTDDPQPTPPPDERERNPAKPELAKVRLDVDLSIVTQAKILGAHGKAAAAPQHTVRLDATGGAGYVWMPRAEGSGHDATPIGQLAPYADAIPAGIDDGIPA